MFVAFAYFHKGNRFILYTSVLSVKSLDLSLTISGSDQSVLALFGVQISAFKNRAVMTFLLFLSVEAELRT
jgi:hypothetical protein